MTDPRIAVLRELGEQLQYGMVQRNRLWEDYWAEQREGRRMVTVPDGLTAKESAEDVWQSPPNETRLFESFPNLAPKGEPMKQNPLIPPFQSFPRAPDPPIRVHADVRCAAWETTVRACIARLKAAREKESMKQNLGSLFAVVIKVQKDLETLVGDDWQKQDAAAEAQVTRDDR